MHTYFHSEHFYLFTFTPAMRQGRNRVNKAQASTRLSVARGRHSTGTLLVPSGVYWPHDKPRQGQALDVRDPVPSLPLHPSAQYPPHQPCSPRHGYVAHSCRHTSALPPVRRTLSFHSPTCNSPRETGWSSLSAWSRWDPQSQLDPTARGREMTASEERHG